MVKKAIITHSKNYQAALDVEGVHVVELASSENSDGSEYTFQFGNAGEGAPSHSHDWDEAFFILKGSATFTCGDMKELCHSGSFIFVPGGTPHSFEFGSEGCEMFDVTGVGSHALPMFKRIADAYAKSKEPEQG